MLETLLGVLVLELEVVLRAGVLGVDDMLGWWMWWWLGWVYMESVLVVSDDGDDGSGGLEK